MPSASAVFRDMFSALYHKNFRYFWLGQAVSTIGSMVQVTALNWYVYKISGSPFLLGLMGVFEFGPVLLLTLFAGVFIERYPKKNILLFTQSLFLLQSLALALLVWMGSTDYWLFAILAIVAGISNSIDQPTRQSYFVELVGKQDLPNAISLNSTTFNLARIVGPAISGLVMKYVGVAECFFINGLSFIPVLYGIAMITIPGVPRKKDSERKVLSEIKQGVIYTFRNSKILPTFLIMAVICTFSMNSNVILPVFAKDVLLGDESTYSMLMSVLGLGSMLGALFMASIGKDIPSKYFLIVVALLIGMLQMMILLYLHSMVLVITTLIVTGFLTLCFLNRANTRIQLNTDDDYRGRVMSIYVLINTGSTPIGNAFTGFAMDRMGEKYGFFSNGLVSFVVVLLLFLIYKHYFGKAKVIPRTDKEKRDIMAPVVGQHSP